MDNDEILSIILLSYFSRERIVRAYNKINKIMNESNIPYELLIVDDGSTDDTFQIAELLEEKYSNVFAYRLSRNYCENYSTFAGIQLARGACITAIPDDEQLPYRVIVQAYNLWKTGEKIIIPHRVSRQDGILKDLLANTFYKIVNLFSDSVKYPKGGADSFLIDREVADIINTRIHPINTSIISEILRLGFSPKFHPYERPKGINEKSRWTLRKKLKLFEDVFYSSSSLPIKLIRYLGIFMSSFSAFLVIFYFTLKVFFPQVTFFGLAVKGWTSLFIIISFFSGTILFALGVIAEYIWRIYEEVKDRPRYIVRKK